MKSRRFVVATFCDDVRQEIGNKTSLIGCYGSDLIVEALPIVLPKFCIYVQAVAPVGEAFPAFTIRAVLNEEPIAELEIPKNDARNGRISAIMSMSPFFIGEPASLDVISEAGDETYFGGSLNIRIATDEERADSPLRLPPRR